ncbi:MAG: response regulator [Elusimicrobiales bacterium]|nr:response regulator [Elusimicrobiales bacterium]
MRVLIVDDNAGTREILRVMLETLGHEVVGEAEDGESALKAFKDLRPEVVLLDIIMPGKNGLVVLGEMLRADRAAKIIMVTAVDQDEVNKQLSLKGAAGAVFKPFSREDISNALAALR